MFLILGVVSSHVTYAAVPSDGTSLGNGAYAVNGYAVMVTNDGALRGYGGKYTACFNVGGYYAASGSATDVTNSCGLNNKKCGNQVYSYNLGPACTYMSQNVGNYCVGNSVYTTDTSCNAVKVTDCPQFCNSGMCVSSLSVGSCTGAPFNANRGYKGVTWSVNGVSGASGNYTYSWSSSCLDQRTYLNQLKSGSSGHYYVSPSLGYGSSATCYYPLFGSDSPSAAVTVTSAATANIPQQAVRVSCVYDACYGSSDPSCKTTVATTTQMVASTTNQTSSASTSTTNGGVNGTGGLSCGSGQIPCGNSCVTPVNGQCPSDLGVILMAAKTGSNIYKRNSLVVPKDSKVDLKWEASSSMSNVICNAINGWDSSTSSSHTTLSPIAIPSSRDFSVSCTDGIKTLLDTVRVLVVGVSEF